MRYLSYVFWIILSILSVFWVNEYFVNHTYYFNMLSNSSNWIITIVWLFISMLFISYLLFYRKKTRKRIIINFLLAFFLFSLTVWLSKWWFVQWWYFLMIINYLILFFYWSIIILWFISIWDFVLKKINFQKVTYEIAIKLWLWLWVVWMILYYIVLMDFLTTITSYIILLLLLITIYIQRFRLKNIFSEILLELNDFSEKLNNNNVLKVLFIIIFSISIWYIFIWLNYAFIPYPTAWDANHAYMFVPKIIWIYNWYPWNTDFRPDLYLWYGFLAWVYQLWFWTRFSQDTWMITFNFFPWIFSLFFWFMLVNTVAKLLWDKSSNKIFNISKHYLIVIIWYILILARLTSWNWAFLVFVDNKTDLAVLMFVILWLFLALYSLLKIKDEKVDKKEIILFVVLAGIFFGIANLIKPTATFDFFETFLLISWTEIWLLTVLWAIMFVFWLLVWIKFRWIDKIISSKLALPLLESWIIMSVWESVIKLIKDKFKILYVLAFVGGFVFTLIITKGVFGILQITHWEKINPNLGKTLPALVMWNRLPTEPKSELTGDLFQNLKKPIGSSYNEDNWRYLWYWDKYFWDVRWKFIIPSVFKKRYCIKIFDNQATIWCDTIIDKKNSYYSKAINSIVSKIFNNKDSKLFNEWILSVVTQAEKNWKLLDLAKRLWISWNTIWWKLKKEIISKLTKNTEKQLLSQIKQNLLSWNLDLNKYPTLFQTEKNKKLFNDILKKSYFYEVVSVPYKYLVPFNEVFNRSLQNLTSYYTDIWIIWLILFIILLYSIIYSLYMFFKWLIINEKSYIDSAKQLFMFSFVTLIWWTIWYFVASGIIWYNLGWIIWLIITTLIFLSKYSDLYILPSVVFLVSILWIFLNLIRISSQWGWEIQNWYRSSFGKISDYEIIQWWIKQVNKEKMPYTSDDVFHLQFNMYKKAIEEINNRNNNEMAIIWWTYMRYFIKNQNKIKADQFLQWLRKMWSDWDVTNTYKRFKNYWLKDIVIDPNIASVVMWSWNISLWYRYFGKVDKNGNLVEKWVFPMFVDLFQSWYLEYWYTNNLWIKYALTVSNEEFKKATWITWDSNIRKIRYELTSLRFIPRNLYFDTKDHNLWNKMYIESINVVYKILIYRLQKALKWDIREFASDFIDVSWLYIKDFSKILWNKKTKDSFDNMTIDEKTLFIWLMSIFNWVSSNQDNIQKIIQQIINNSLWSRSQLLFIKVK